jgi:hypothetical protein
LDIALFGICCGSSYLDLPQMLATKPRNDDPSWYVQAMESCILRMIAQMPSLYRIAGETTLFAEVLSRLGADVRPQSLLTIS